MGAGWGKKYGKATPPPPTKNQNQKKLLFAYPSLNLCDASG